MKKIKLVVNLIYILGFGLIGIFTVFFVYQTVSKGTELYFQEKKPGETTSLFSQKEINEALDLLQKYGIIK